ncbi:MAG: exodeoxyribonuclease III [Coriobacteriales bacterium]|nr:exodeoxyribonuclease III [Coriobacteriales bacterium]
MKMVSWNVNGLRAAIKKGFYHAFDSLDADIFALQETKLQAGQVALELPGCYHDYWSYAARKGYAGTAVFCRQKPLRVLRQLEAETDPSQATPDAQQPPQTSPSVQFGTAAKASGDRSKPTDPSLPTTSAPSTQPSEAPDDAAVLAQLNSEGRIVALEFAHYWFVCCYTPNAQEGLTRLEPRLIWERAFRRFVERLNSEKPVIICGDLNVAHEEIDLKNYQSNRGKAGFTDQERAAFDELLAAGFTDSFRYLYPERRDAYTWWSFRGNARANNTGWRIDYFLVSNRLAVDIQSADIYPHIMGSDHCPISLGIAL